MDLNERMARAVRAATHGDLDAVEVELSLLRSVPAESLAALRAQLRGIARSVQAHPSFARPVAAQAG